jgi:hypothetical protein
VSAGVFGTTGRNILSGPGLFRLDFSLFKTFAFTERIKMEIRNPNGSLTSSSFGQVTGTVSSGTGVNGVGTFGRALQIGAKLTF